MGFFKEIKRKKLLKQELNKYREYSFFGAGNYTVLSLSNGMMDDDNELANMLKKSRYDFFYNDEPMQMMNIIDKRFSSYISIIEKDKNAYNLLLSVLIDEMGIRKFYDRFFIDFYRWYEKDLSESDTTNQLNNISWSVVFFADKKYIESIAKLYIDNDFKPEKNDFICCLNNILQYIQSDNFDYTLEYTSYMDSKKQK